VAQFLDAEARAVAQDVELLTEFGPFRKVPVEEQE
jgi:hypothetical protein